MWFYIDTPLPKLIPAVHDEDEEEDEETVVSDGAKANNKEENVPKSLVSPDAVAAINTPFPSETTLQPLPLPSGSGETTETTIFEPTDTLSSKYYFQEVDPEAVNTFIADFGQSEDIDNNNGASEVDANVVDGNASAPAITNPSTLSVSSKVSFSDANTNPPTTPHSCADKTTTKRKFVHVPSFSFINGSYVYYEAATTVPQEIDRVKLKRALSLANDLSEDAKSTKYGTSPYAEGELPALAETQSAKRRKRE